MISSFQKLSRLQMNKNVPRNMRGTVTLTMIIAERKPTGGLRVYYGAKQVTVPRLHGRVYRFFPYQVLARRMFRLAGNFQAHSTACRTLAFVFWASLELSWSDCLE